MKGQIQSIFVLIVAIGIAGVAGGQTALPVPGVTGNLNVADAANWTNGLPTATNVGTITLSATVDAYFQVWSTWRDDKSIIIESSDGHGLFKFTKADGLTLGTNETQIRNNVDITLNSGTWEPYGDRQGLYLTGPTSKVTVNGGLLDCDALNLSLRSDGALMIQNGGTVRCKALHWLASYPTAMYVFNGGTLELGPGGISGNNVRIDFGPNNDGVLLINAGTDYRETLADRVQNGVFRIGGEPISNFGRFHKVAFDAATGITTLQLIGPVNPLEAKNPSPENGAGGTPLTVTLSWTAGTSAVQHGVYLGENFDDVNDAVASTAKGRQTATTYGPVSVELSKTYYWRVDEVQADGTVTKGRVWFFSPPQNLLIDDFERYDDNEPNRVWKIWKDGYEIDENGSEVGYAAWGVDTGHDNHIENKLKHGGNFSMPFTYNNTVAKYSEVSVNLADLGAARDWSVGGAKVLDIWINTDAANDPEPMYLKLSDGTNTAKITHPDPEAASKDGWSVWHIVLQEGFETGNTYSLQEYISVLPTGANLDLSKVATLAIGVGNPDAPAPSGRSGLMFIDDIAVFGTRCIDALKPTMAQGNLNGDCVIDQKDLDLLTSNWLKSGLWP